MNLTAPINTMCSSVNKHQLTHISSTLRICQFSSVTKRHPTLCDPTDYGTPGFPVLHHLLEFVQTHVHWVGDAIQPSHPLLSPPLPAFNLSEEQGLFQQVDSSHQVAKVLEFQLQNQSFQWIVRVDFLSDWRAFSRNFFHAGPWRVFKTALSNCPKIRTEHLDSWH